MRNLFKSDIVRLQKQISEMKMYTVYFLLNENDIIYVGFSETPFTRISSHFNDKVFDGYFMLHFSDKEEAMLTETHYIKTFCPFYNKKDNPNSVPIKKVALYRNGTYNATEFEIVREIKEVPTFFQKKQLLVLSQVKINIPTGTYIRKSDNKYYFNIKGKIYTYVKESDCYELDNIIVEHPKNTYGNICGFIQRKI